MLQLSSDLKAQNCKEDANEHGFDFGCRHWHRRRWRSAGSADHEYLADHISIQNEIR